MEREWMNARGEEGRESLEQLGVGVLEALGGSCCSMDTTCLADADGARLDADLAWQQASHGGFVPHAGVSYRALARLGHALLVRQ